jgi:hypothetical protein
MLQERGPGVMDKYIVNVGNIGNIAEKTRKDADKTYNEYVRQSKAGYGRGGEEDVILMIDGEAVREFSFTDWMIARYTGHIETARNNVAVAKRTQRRAEKRLQEYLQSLE